MNLPPFIVYIKVISSLNIEEKLCCMIMPHARNIEIALVVDETAASSKANGYI